MASYAMASVAVRDLTIHLTNYTSIISRAVVSTPYSTPSKILREPIAIIGSLVCGIHFNSHISAQRTGSM
jgi:hypothetical protein